MRLEDRCSADIVVDTNILSHADNPSTSQNERALQAVRWLETANVAWVLDDQGKSAPDPATSVLYAEYRATLAPGGYAYAVFVRMLQSQRVRFARRPNQQERGRIRRLVPRNRKDQAVLGAAINTHDRLLLSNDLNDFDDSVRREAHQIWGADIVHSDDVEL